MSRRNFFRNKSIFSYLSFFIYFPGRLFRGLMESSFGFRSREDWFFAATLYIISIILFVPTIYWLGFILTVLCWVWCLFIWFFYRLPFDKMTKSIASFLEKRNIELTYSGENDPSSILTLPTIYKVIIFFWYFLALGITFIIGMSPLLLKFF